MKNRHILQSALALLLTFIVVAYPLQRDALSPAEARALWLVSDPPTSQRESDESLRARLAHTRDSLVFAYNRTREESEFVLYYPLLDIWQSLMGTSIFAGRLPSMWLSMLALAAVFTLAKHLYTRRIALGVLAGLAVFGFIFSYARHISPHSLVLAILALVIFILVRWRGLERRPILIAGLFGAFLCCAPMMLPQYRPSAAPTVIAQAAEVREAGAPAITMIDQQSPFSYYSRHERLIQGISLDLSWQPFTTEEVQGYVTVLTNAPSVWLVMPEGSDLTADAIVAFVSQGYVMGYQANADGMLIYRFDEG
jgi:hypothetical protein